MKKKSKKKYINIKLRPMFIKNTNALFSKSEFKEFEMLLIAIAILINSKKTDAILLALASTALITLLAGKNYCSNLLYILLKLTQKILG